MLRPAWREIKYRFDVGRATNESHLSVLQVSIDDSTLVLIFINDILDGINAVLTIYTDDITIYFV